MLQATVATGQRERIRPIAVSEMREKLLTHLRSTQVNRAAGYIPKIQRLREAEKKQLRLAGEAADSQPFD